MSKIMKGGVEYAAGGAWEGTQAEYDALQTIDPNITYYITDGVPASHSIVHSYTATLTSSQYGWFIFVDEVGNALLPAKGVPIAACTVVGQNYYVGQFIIISGKWQFKVAEINNSSNPTVGTQLNNITFTMAYIECHN